MEDDQLEPTYSSSVPMRDVVLKTCRKQWTIERSDEKGSGISELLSWHDDDDEDDDINNGNKSDYLWHWICTLPHNIATLLAKILSPLFGSINDAHIKNSSSLLNKLNDLNNTSLASLYIISLYTNTPVDWYIKGLDNHLRKTNSILLLYVSKLIKVRTLCTSHWYFQHKRTFYKHKFGLPIGSPLSGIFACNYLEILESGPFKYIISSSSS